MRQLLAACALVLVAASAAASVKEVHKVVPLAPNGSVSVDTHNGSIDVTTWNQPSVAIDARIEPEPHSSHPEDVDATEVDVRGGGANVEIVSNYDRVPERSLFLFGSTRYLPLIRYTIRVPATATVRIVNHNAFTRVTGLRGDVRVRTHNGATTVRDLSGSADIESHNGAVDVEYVNFTKASRLETHNAALTVVLPANARFRVHRETHHGYLSSDFGIGAGGTVNGGGPELRIETHNGALMLRKR